MVFAQTQVYLPVRWFSGGSRGGARGTLAPPLIFGPNWDPKGRKKNCFWDRPPPLISGPGWFSPLPVTVKTYPWSKVFFKTNWYLFKYSTSQLRPYWRRRTRMNIISLPADVRWGSVVVTHSFLPHRTPTDVCGGGGEMNAWQQPNPNGRLRGG